MKRISALAIAAALFAAFLARVGSAPSARAREVAAGPNDYLIEASGTDGVRLRMLLVHKPKEDESPARIEDVIRLPYKKSFRGAKCYAWFDTLPDGEGGKAGDKCRIELKINGILRSAIEADLKPETKTTGGFGDW